MHGETIKLAVSRLMSTGRRCNETDRGKPKYPEISLYQSHFTNH